MKHIDIRMLGSFTLQAGDAVITDETNRSRKVWGLLAYLICHRGGSVSQKKLIELLWGDEPSSSNPENALRITLHRLRAQLDLLWPGAGKDLILHKNGSYSWNNQISIQVDSDRFEELCQSKYVPDSTRLDLCLEALSLYRGDFLERQSSENWIIPVTTHFHNLFVLLSLETAQLLSQQNRHQEAAHVCRRGITAEPYHEPLYQMLMKELAADGDQKGAASVYESLRKRLFDDFGIRPSEETEPSIVKRLIPLKNGHCPSTKFWSTCKNRK